MININITINRSNTIALRFCSALGWHRSRTTQLASHFHSPPTMLADNLPARLGLLQFLKQARVLQGQHVAGTISSSSGPVYVLGNPSADLDSIVSAIIYSYFASGRIPSQQNGRPHVPLINLIDVPSGSDLRRLRPEFVTALWLATNPGTSVSESWDNNGHHTAHLLREHFLTVMDLKAQLREHEREQGGRPRQWNFDTTMVDWNALQLRSKEGEKGRGGIEKLPDVHFDVVGCIDHHVDEHFVPPLDSLPAGYPRIIQPGPGSCTSLVVRELRARGLWPDHPATDLYEAVGPLPPADVAAIYEAQAAKLALAAILIDTTNLTTEGKVTEVDRTAVAFLEAKVEHGYAIQRSLHQHKAQVQSQQAIHWDRATFFSVIQSTKQNSLDLLTVEEVLGRDYKDWTEPSTSGASIRLGMCTIVKPISWIIRKASNSSRASTEAQAKEFLNDLRDFSETRELDVVAIMTAFPSAVDGQFRRELLVWALNTENPVVEGGAKRFAKRAAQDLGLEDWFDDGQTPGDGEGIRAVLNSDSSAMPGWRRLWRQTDVTKSRKQVAPLLRTALAE